MPMCHRNGGDFWANVKMAAVWRVHLTIATHKFHRSCSTVLPSRLFLPLPPSPRPPIITRILQSLLQSTQPRSQRYRRPSGCSKPDFGTETYYQASASASAPSRNRFVQLTPPTDHAQ